LRLKPFEPLSARLMLPQMSRKVGSAVAPPAQRPLIWDLCHIRILAFWQGSLASLFDQAATAVIFG